MSADANLAETCEPCVPLWHLEMQIGCAHYPPSNKEKVETAAGGNGGTHPSEKNNHGGQAHLYKDSF